MNLETKNLDFSIEQKADDGSTFSGYASCWHNIDSYGDIIAPGAFSEDLPRFLAKGFVAYQHDWEHPIGKPLSAKEDGRGLYAEAKISDTALGRDCKTLMKDGVIQSLSIGYRTTGREWLETADDVRAYWSKHGYQPTGEDEAKAPYGVRLITKIKLYEFSPVSAPANEMCDITQVKGGALEARTFESHSSQVLDTVREYIDRAKSYAGMCEGDNREPSRKRLAEFRQLKDALDALLSEPEAKGLPPALNPDHLMARFLEIEARLWGV